MKTTIEIRDELFYFAKEEALRRRTTLRAVIEEQIEEMHRVHLKNIKSKQEALLKKHTEENK